MWELVFNAGSASSPESLHMREGMQMRIEIILNFKQFQISRERERQAVKDWEKIYKWKFCAKKKLTEGEKVAETVDM
jgi:hypothetical protein